MKIKNIEGLSLDEIKAEINNGGKFVVFYHCVAFFAIVFWRTGDVYFVRNGETAGRYSTIDNFITLGLGFWVLPVGWAVGIYFMFYNITGGKDVTNEVLKLIEEDYEVNRLMARQD